LSNSGRDSYASSPTWRWDEVGEGGSWIGHLEKRVVCFRDGEWGLGVPCRARSSVSKFLECSVASPPRLEGGFFGGACATLECEFGRCERHAPGAGPARGTLGEQTARERLSGDGSSHAAAPRVVVHRWCSRWCLALTRFVDELTRIFQDSVSDVSISPADQSESPTRGANTRKQNQVARATRSGEQTSLAFT
jgi:hypothetical protein